MKISFREFLVKAIFFVKHYVFQTILATLVIYIILLNLSLQQAVIIASLGATTFIVFAMPKAVTARPRNVIGGQIVGLACGYLSVLIPYPEFFHYSIVYAIAVGLSMFIMEITNTEHPPASGTALGVAMTGFSWNVAIAVIASVLALSFIHTVFRGYLEDLT
jgi:CBS-domain-containing membrane protein